MIPGIDVSHWQKDIDWAQVKKAGVRFAFYKATEFPLGKTQVWIDPNLQANAAGTASNRIHASPYHFFRTHVPGEYQAIAFIEAIRHLPFGLAPALDLEQAGFRGRPLCNEVLAFLQRVEDAFQIKPIIYTSGAFWREYMIHDKFENVLPFSPYKLWLAQWGFTMPKPVFPFPAASFWQYSETGRIPGVKPYVDLDYFMGDEIGLLPFFCLNRFTDQKPPTERITT
jgi:lysozyme